MWRGERRKELLLCMEEEGWIVQVSQSSCYVHNNVLLKYLWKPYQCVPLRQIVVLLSTLFSVGYFLEPTVFTDVEDHMMVAHEESFGPIMIISSFENGYNHMAYVTWFSAYLL